jgi:hypothetical protein
MHTVTADSPVTSSRRAGYAHRSVNLRKEL